MLIHLQRAMTIFAIALWFGGFTFYTACVLRIGSKVVGGLTQGFVTQRVMRVLELLAAVMVVAVIIDIATHWKRIGRWLRTLQCVAWSTMAASLIGIVLIHNKMDPLLDPGAFAKPDHEAFSPFHQAYQFISTCMWVATVVYVLLVVRVYATPTTTQNQATLATRANT